MTIPSSSASSLFPNAKQADHSVGRRQRLEQAVQRFEGMLWNEVAQAMSSVKLGPSGTGYGGQVYQRMMWRRVARSDFANMDRGLTRTTLQQLTGSSGSSKTALDRNAAATSTRKTTRTASATSGDPASDPQSWIQHVWHAIKSGAEALGVPVRGLLAQAALETGWGQHATSHNLFGVKAHQSAQSSFSALTHEFSAGAMRQVHARFQAYPSVDHAVNDFVSVMRRAHPDALGHATVAGYARALQNSGYATDPRYAAKIEAVADSSRMHQMLSAVKQ